MSAASAKRRLVVVRHVAFEHLGTLAHAFEADGWSIDYREAGVHDLLDRSADGIVILGGPISANDDADFAFLTDEFALVEHALARSVPMVGVCLGAQVIARVLGARVEPMAEPEIGFAPLELAEAAHASVLAPFAAAPAFHWHGERIAGLPAADVLATTRAGAVVQAFRSGERALGVQCHLEFPPDDLPLWLVGHSHELAHHGIRPDTLRQQCAQARAGYETASRAFARAAVAELFRV